MDQATLELVRSHLRSVRVPGPADKVYKEECGFSFARSESLGGLYINLGTWQAYSEEWLDLDHRRTEQGLYLHELGTKVPRETDEDSNTEPTELAIGKPGGFAAAQGPLFDVVRDHALVVMPSRVRVALPCPELPELVLQAISAIQAHESASKQEEVAAWSEERRVSKYAAGLEQLDTGRRVPQDPGQWRCDETGVTDNLWLNLSTGFIGSGRPHWDGSGGNGAALRHYEATGRRYPLAVKLGTITPAGADVYSYAADEDDMVSDPDLAAHLAHWGINILLMSKTEASMTELQIAANKSLEFERMTEAGTTLRPVHGPGYTGLRNLGNSCYLNSVLQVLWSLPQTALRLLPNAAETFRTAPRVPADDLLTQFVKVGRALAEGATPVETGDKGEPPAPLTAVSPAAFKALVGRGHPEFSTNHQQDAEEFLGYLIDKLARAERAAGSERLPDGDAAPMLQQLVSFVIEDRIQCTETGKVSYKQSTASTLGLHIPLDLVEMAQTAQADADRELKRPRTETVEHGPEEPAGDGPEHSADKQGLIEPPRIGLPALLHAFFDETEVEGVWSAAAAKNTTARKQTRLGSFPEVLLVQLRRYYVGDDWRPRKLELAVDMPEHMDLSAWRAGARAPDEELQPESAAANDADAAASTPSGPVADDALVSTMVSMGFSENAGRRAALAVSNSGPEAAMEWLVGHLDDPDINDPPCIAGASGGAAAIGSAQPDPEAVSLLTGMGFTNRAAAAALRACAGDLERAADWLFSRMDSLDELEADEEGSAEPPAGAQGGGSAPSAGVLDGSGTYELAAFICHMGANTACGHYVCHIKKEGRWVLYNDEKVAVSEHPPMELGYLYFYRRVQASAGAVGDESMQA